VEPLPSASGTPVGAAPVAAAGATDDVASMMTNT
jgi:hypothetical protein